MDFLWPVRELMRLFLFALRPFAVLPGGGGGQGPPHAPDPKHCDGCGENLEDGILCDGCGKWICLDNCLNSVQPDTVPQLLYDELKKVKKPFAWKCHVCQPDKLLPLQLVEAKWMTLQQASSTFKCNPAALRSQKKAAVLQAPRFAPPAPAVAPEGPATQGVGTEAGVAALMEALRLAHEERAQALRQAAEDRHEAQRAAREDREAFFASLDRFGGAPRASGAASGAAPVARLPPISLKTFEGNIVQWPAYWANFRLNVDERTDLPDRMKMEYLVQTLRGRALDKVASLVDGGGESYAAAVAILKSNYSDPTSIFNANMRSLKQLSPVRPGLANLESFCDTITICCENLNKLGYDEAFRDALVEAFLWEKLPDTLRSEIGRQRFINNTVDEKWTMKGFIETLSRFRKLAAVTEAGQSRPVTTGKKSSATAEATGESASHAPPTCMFFTQQGRVEAGREQRGAQRGSRGGGQMGRGGPSGRSGRPSGIHSANVYAGSGRRGPRYPCIFCSDRQHFSDDCSRVCDVEARRQLLRSQRRCFVCLASGFDSGHHCNRQRPCFHCGQTGIHHASICDKRQNAHPRQMKRTSQMVALWSAEGAETPTAKTPDASNSVPAAEDPGKCPPASEPPSAPSSKPLPAAEASAVVTAPSVAEPLPQPASTAAEGPTALPNAPRGPSAEPQWSTAANTVASSATKCPLVSGRVVMATFPAFSVNPRTGKEIGINVFLDTGCQHSSVSAQKVRELELPSSGRVTLTAARFGAKKRDKMEAEVVDMKLTTVTGFTLKLRVFAVEKLTPPLLLEPLRLPPHAQRLLAQLKPVNAPPKAPLSTRIDLILGLDHFQSILGPKVPATPICGHLLVYHTKVGNILCGNPDAAGDLGTLEHMDECPIEVDCGSETGKCCASDDCAARPAHCPDCGLQREKCVCGEEEGSDSCLPHPLCTTTLNCAAEVVCPADGASRADARLDGQVEQLWRLESLGIDGSEDSVSQTNLNKKLQDFFDATTTFQDGRYFVRLPFKEEEPKLPSNYQVALKRLHSTLRMLKRRGKLAEYNAILSEQRAQGITELADKPHGRLVHFISHFPVFKTDSEHTKTRVVYDAATKAYPDGRSLNDLVHVGQSLLEDMLGLLIKFQVPPYILATDVARAFLNVGLHKEDQDACSFLWIEHDEEKDGPIEELDVSVLSKLRVSKNRMCRIPFGIASSPYLLLSVIKHHLSLSPSPLAPKLLDSLYMDNLLIDLSQPSSGAESPDVCSGEDSGGTLSGEPSTALAAYHESRAVFASASMRLRQYLTNDQVAMRHIPKEDQAGEPIVKVLGIKWDSIKDTWSIYQGLRSEGCSKRSILQGIARTFDVLGFLSPVTVRGRILVQDLWKAGSGWDAPASPAIEAAWLEVLEDLRRASEIEFPRRLFPGQEGDYSFSLVGICDASLKAFAAAVYLRSEPLAGGPAVCRLVFAKAKVAPVKPLTIVRLELMANLICARALRMVKAKLGLPITNMVQFSDSQVCLHFFQSKKPLKAFVGNRVSEIVDPGDVELRYIPTAQNVADLPSKGVRLATLLESEWLGGPAFLAHTEGHWPVWEYNPGAAADAAQEEKPQPCVPASQSTDTLHLRASLTPHSQPPASGPFGIDPARFSRLQRLLRVTAYCQRFISGLKGKPRATWREISAEEMDSAQELWYIAIQDANFAKEKQLLSSGKASQLINQLDLFLEGQLIRCGGRLDKSALSRAECHPILLPGNNAFTDLVILKAHLDSAHFKLKPTLSLLRRTVWVTQGQSQVSRVLRQKCLLCQRAEGGALIPPKMAGLPKDRLQRAPSFLKSGFDYVGPFLIKKPGADQEFVQRYIGVFSCMTTRACIFDVVESVTGESTVNCIIRAMSRVGTFGQLVTDNASGFDRAADIFNQIWNCAMSVEDGEQIVAFFAAKGIVWKRIRPRSPWEGAFYERIMGLIRRACRKLLWRRCVTEEALRTIVAQIEAFANCRPLLSLQPAPNDGGILMPADFLCPGTQLGLPPVSADRLADPDYLAHSDKRAKDNLVAFYRQQEKLLDSYWKLWQTEYLQSLREAHQTYFPKQKGASQVSPKVGRTYLVRQAGPSPRLTWPLARCTKLLPSDDGHVRFVELQTANGYVTRRGVKDLVPLEMEMSEDAAESHAKGLLAKAEVTGSPDGDLDVAAALAEAEEEAEDPADLFPPLAHSAPARKGSPTRQNDVSPPRRRSKRLAGKSALVTTLALLMLVSSAAASERADGGYQLCMEGKGGKAYVLPRQLPPCVWPERERVSSSLQVELWVPNPRLPTAQVHLCQREEVRVCGYVSVLGARGMTMPGAVRRFAVPAEECRLAVRSKFYKGVPLVQFEPNLWSTNHSISIPYEYCCREVCKTSENFLLHAGTLASQDGVSMNSNIADFGGCELRHGSCKTAHWTAVWSLRTLGSYCAFERKGSFQAVGNHRFLTIDQLRSSFTLHDRKKKTFERCLPSQAVMTLEGEAVVFQGKPSSPLPASQASQPVASEAFNVTEIVEALAERSLPDPVSAKLTRLQDFLDSEMADRFRLVHFSFCNLARQAAELTLALVKLDATLGFRHLLGGGGFAAVAAGDAYLLHTCTKVSISHVYKDHKVPGHNDCFLFLPLQTSHGLLFAPPGSRDVVTESPKKDCHDVYPSIIEDPLSSAAHREFNGQHGRIHVTQLNPLLKWNETNRHSHHRLIFDSPPLFSSQAILPLAAQAGFAAEVPGLGRSVAATRAYAAQLSLRPGIVAEALEGAGKAVRLLVQASDQAAESILHRAEDGFGSLSDHILSPMLTALVVVVVCALGVLLLIAALYYAAKSRGLKPPDPRLLLSHLRNFRSRHSQKRGARDFQKSVRKAENQAHELEVLET